MLAHIEGPRYYVRYVDDTFCVFENEIEAGAFCQALNTLHPPLHFTFEKNNGVIPFLDILVHRSGTYFLTSV